MPDELESLDEPEALDKLAALGAAVGPDRRTFVKRLVVGSAFAAPVVSSFTMSGIDAVFGSKVGATTLMANSNTAGPDYPTLVKCGTVGTTGLALNGPGGNGTEATVGVPPGALPNRTPMCVYRGKPSTFTALLPSGYTPKSAFAVVWVGPNASAPITLAVNDPAVDVGDVVFVVKGSTAETYPGAVGTDLWAVLFTQDPNFVVATPPTPPPTPTPAGPPSGTTAAAPVQASPTFTG